MSRIALVIALALAALAAGCASDEEDAADERPGFLSLNGPPPTAETSKPATDHSSTAGQSTSPTASATNQSAPATATGPSAPAPEASSPETLSPETSSNVASLPPARPEGWPQTIHLGNDPMVLKKALQDGEATPISLPRDLMLQVFRTPEPFQPSPKALQVIESYAKQLRGPDQARLNYELQTCRTAPSCVVVPLR